MSIEKTYRGMWSTDQALFKKIIDSGHTVLLLLDYDHTCRIARKKESGWGEFDYEFFAGPGKWWGDKIYHSSIRFLIPPCISLEPKPLEWKAVYMNEVGGAEIVAIDGYWSFYAWDNGGWMISIDGTCVHDGASGTDLNNGTFDTAKAAIHEWRVNHLKSMIQ